MPAFVGGGAVFSESASLAHRGVYLDLQLIGDAQRSTDMAITTTTATTASVIAVTIARTIIFVPRVVTIRIRTIALAAMPKRTPFARLPATNSAPSVDDSN